MTANSQLSIVPSPALLGLTVDPYTIFEKCILDQKKEYPDHIPVLNLIQNGETLPFLRKKSYSLWQGKQKSKKTTALSIAVSAFIRTTKDTNPIRFECAEPHLLFNLPYIA